MRSILRNNANMLWKKPFLRKFKDIPDEDEKHKIKLHHKKAKPEQIQMQKELNYENNRVLWFKKLAAILISLVIIVSLYFFWLSIFKDFLRISNSTIIDFQA